MSLSATNILRPVYCSNQVTEKKLKNYATDDIDLCKKLNKFDSVLTDLLNEDNCKYLFKSILKCYDNGILKTSNPYELSSLINQISTKNLNGNDSEMNQLKIVSVGNKINRQLNKGNEIDYSDIPKVACLIDKKNSSMNRTESCKRKTCENYSDDETDSSIDCKLIQSKKFKQSVVANSYSKESEIFTDMSEKDLWRLANNYSELNDYKSIAIELGIDETDILIIESKYLNRDGLRECFYQCLLTWRLNQPENCSLNKFIDVLKLNLNKSNIFIENLKQKLIHKSELEREKNRNTLSLYLKDDQISKFNLTKLKIEESHLWEASNFMSVQWKIIGRNLGLDEADLNSIEAKYLYTEGMRECCYQALLLWSQIFYESANLENLCLILIQTKHNLYAKKLIQIML